MFCSQPFNQVEIYENGEVYTCCPDFINHYSIGNIFKTPFEQIWNGEKVLNFRKKILNNDFSICKDICHRKLMIEENTDYKTELIEKFPSEISISTDKSCNVKCTICRDEHINNKYNDKDIEKEINNIWLPILKDAKLVKFGCTGEPFFSKKESVLIKKSAEKYPNLKFHFHTNGILGTEKKLNELGIYNRIKSITVSMHAYNEKTYKRIVKDGNYKKVRTNLNLYAKMKKNNLIQDFRLIFVVIADNYKEMPEFAQLAKELGATVEFWAYRKNSTNLGQNYKKTAIIEKEHEEHENLLNILKNEIFNETHINLYPEIKNLRR